MAKAKQAPKDQFEAAWMEHAPGFEAPKKEFVFHESRKWRFDYAWPFDFGKKRFPGGVAVEIEGGSFSKFRHTSGIGHHNDCDKYNSAAVLGWKVLRFTAKHFELDSQSVIETVLEAMGVFDDSAD